jgi:Phosphoenolpyruvate phosphomutase
MPVAVQIRAKSGIFGFLGRLDGGATLDEVCRHIAALDRATGLPVSADLENGYGASPEQAAHAVSRARPSGLPRRFEAGAGSSPVAPFLTAVIG